MQATKSSRASSCVHCRQVKLKCDRRERYPSACTRCATTGSDCKTDAAFKRFSSRTRVKELEKEVERLQRAQSLERIVPSRPLSCASINNSGGSGGSDRSPSNPAPEPVKWLQAHEEPHHVVYRLGGVTLSPHDAIGIFQEFEELYFPHFAILEPVTGLTELVTQDELLFWTIINVVFRGKADFPQRAVFQAAFDELLGRVCSEAIQSLTDLQALLLTIAYPPNLRGVARDPSWMRNGMAINAARQMGIDKQQDEVLFGARHTKHRLSRHPQHIVKLTFLKVFELDILLSSWLGHVPTLATAYHLRSVGRLVLDPDVPRDYAATIDVHLAAAQYLATEGNSGLSVDAARLNAAALDTVKVRHARAWTLKAEIALLAAKMHVTVMGVLSLSSEELDHDCLQSTSMIGILQSACDTAQTIITLLSNLSEGQLDHGAPTVNKGADPLPGCPKIYSNILFFASTVVIYCIDVMENAPIPIQTEEARNALGRAYKLFTKCEQAIEHQHAAGTLDVAIKNIGKGRVWFRNIVRTRSAASLVYSLIWLAGVARGREHDPEFSFEAAERQKLALRKTGEAEQDLLGDGDWWADFGLGEDAEFFDFLPDGFNSIPYGAGQAALPW
ncbi:Regulatory protein leu3 [Elasticomyces elasticus]|nr:Regulatory protein leu3 [Elasticomyces elasticus]